MKCPGQDLQYWKPGAIYDAACPRCGRAVEFFKDDTARTCPGCGHRFVNPQMDFGCAAYCPFAEQCLGTLPEGAAIQREALLKDRVAVEMKRRLGKDFKRIGHSSRVARHAERIGAAEAGPLAVILPAAYLHELPAEADGTGPAREILQRLGARPELIAEVCDALDRLQRPAAADDPPCVNVLRDAHRLDEIEERRKSGETAGIGETDFQTGSGRRMAAELPRPDQGLSGCRITPGMTVLSGDDRYLHQNDRPGGRTAPRNPMKVIRKIIQIDEELCNGCGNCVPSCAEGALEIVDGKARVIADIYCDGLGACLGECPTGALTIQERAADEFDEHAVEERLAHATPATAPVKQVLPMGGGCPGQRPQSFGAAPDRQASAPGPAEESALSHWPIQIMLVPPTAPFLQGADLLVLADCVPVAFPTLHRDFLQGKRVMMGCPKLDNVEAYVDKFAQIARVSGVRSITTVVMEVPCCAALPRIVRQGLERAGARIPMEEVVISVRGKILARRPAQPS